MNPKNASLPSPPVQPVARPLTPAEFFRMIKRAIVAECEVMV